MFSDLSVQGSRLITKSLINFLPAASVGLVIGKLSYISTFPIAKVPEYRTFSLLHP